VVSLKSVGWIGEESLKATDRRVSAKLKRASPEDFRRRQMGNQEPKGIENTEQTSVISNKVFLRFTRLVIIQRHLVQRF
jgi:hypothetical protein